MSTATLANHTIHPTNPTRAGLFAELTRLTGVPASVWRGTRGESEPERQARLARLANVLLTLDDEVVALGVAVLHRQVAGEAQLEPLEPYAYNRGWWYTAGRDATGRPSDMPTGLTVSLRGHWFRADDALNHNNDRICRGCTASGHWEYIIDSTAGDCPNPPTATDIRTALSIPTATPVQMPQQQPHGTPAHELSTTA